jgi:hypothetical protein
MSLDLPQIVDPNDVRAKLVPATVDDQTIDDAVQKGNGEIVSATNKRDWAVTDNAYSKVKDLGTYYAVWWILINWDETMYGKKADRFFQAYTNAVNHIKDFTFENTETNPAFDVVQQIDKNPYTNPDLPPYLDHL